MAWADVHIIEPVLFESFTFSVSAGDAADEVRLIHSFRHDWTSTATAFNLTSSAQLPGYLKFVNETVTGGGDSDRQISTVVGQQRANMTLALLPVGSQFAVEYKVRFDTEIPPGLSLEATANTTHASLPTGAEARSYYNGPSATIFRSNLFSLP